MLGRYDSYFTYHILFLFCAEDFILEDAKHYIFLTQGKVVVPGFDEVAEFQATVKAMQIMGINNEDINGMILNIQYTVLLNTCIH